VVGYWPCIAGCVYLVPGGAMTVAMTLEERQELADNTQLLAQLLTLLERFTALDDVLLSEPLQHTRWAIQKLAKRNWRLTS